MDVLEILIGKMTLKIVIKIYKEEAGDQQEEYKKAPKMQTL